MESKKRYPRTILASALIPWTENYEFDEKIFRRQVKAITDRGINHIYIFGTAGEGYAVSDDQYEKIVSAFADEMSAPDLQPMAGIISNSFTTMIKRIRQAYIYGIRDFMITMPSWGVLSDIEMNRFFHDICDPFPDCRFVYYNLLRTKRLLSVKELEVLACEIPNLVGVKFCSNDFYIVRDISITKSELQFFVTEAALFHGNWLGECSLLITLGNINIKKALEYFNAVVNGDINTAMMLYREYMMLHKGLFMFCEESKIDGAYDKLYSKLVDPEFPLRLLPPYTGYSEEVFEKFRQFVKKNYPLWLEPQSMY